MNSILDSAASGPRRLHIRIRTTSFATAPTPTHFPEAHQTCPPDRGCVADQPQQRPPVPHPAKQPTTSDRTPLHSIPHRNPPSTPASGTATFLNPYRNRIRAGLRHGDVSNPGPPSCSFLPSNSCIRGIPSTSNAPIRPLKSALILLRRHALLIRRRVRARPLPHPCFNKECSNHSSQRRSS